MLPQARGICQQKLLIGLLLHRGKKVIKDSRGKLVATALTEKMVVMELKVQKETKANAARKVKKVYKDFKASKVRVASKELQVQ